MPWRAFVVSDRLCTQLCLLRVRKVLMPWRAFVVSDDVYEASHHQLACVLMPWRAFVVSDVLPMSFIKTAGWLS